MISQSKDQNQNGIASKPVAKLVFQKQYKTKTNNEINKYKIDWMKSTNYQKLLSKP